MKKIFLMISTILFIFMSIETFDQYNKIKETEALVVKNEVKILSDFIKSFRKVYQDIFIEEKIIIDEKTLNLLPVKSIRRIVKDFSKKVDGEVIIRTVSDNPRNIKNIANIEEEKAILFFRENPLEKNRFKQFKNKYIYTVPLKIENSCLKCHGKREKAIPMIRERYSKAYNYKLGDLRGIISITIKKDNLLESFHSEFIKIVIINILLYFTILSYIYYLLRKLERKECEEKEILKKKIKEATKELEKKQEFLDHQAHHDYLTGLPNRILFNDRLEHSIEIAKRKKKSLSVFFIDLDHFKEINDSLGHHIGDEVLQKIAQKLKNIIRGEDTLARLGGDEFTIIMENVKNENSPSILAEKILNELIKPIILKSKKEIYITCSIGISVYPEDSEEKKDLIKYADAAMYKAKDKGRSNFVFYSKKLTEISLERIQIETEIRSAIKNNELELYYQPQINSDDETLIGVEALVRWNHPTKGFLTPYHFIEIAEKTNLIIDLDNWVMKEGLKQLKEWQNLGYFTGILSLNLSIRQLMSKEFILNIEKNIKEIDYNPKLLELEISEKTIMKNQEEAIEKLNIIKSKSINISIDDFGKGFASLSYLKDLPINKVKIDKSFVDGLPNNNKDMAIVKAIIDMSKALELSIIAEGVESKKQMEFLRDNGCSDIQGYYYDKPLSAKEFFNKYLKNQKK